RKTHEALHGTVMRYDDPFWEAFYPPNGWGCRCSVVAMSERDITRRKVTVTSSGDSLGYIAKRVSDMAIDSVAAFVTPTGIVVSPDIGWSYSPGAAYRPDLAKYGGDLAALAQQELVP
ncbi:phage head morphogenesis protein, partial [Escherichia coli]